MNELKIFENEEFGKVRVVDINGEPWMVGNDVARTLGYKETAKAIREHVDCEDKGVSEIDTPGGRQKITIINESGLYALVLSSKLPTAKKFRRWVTSEVLPSIRKTGGYHVPKTYAEALRAYADEVEKKELLMLENAEMKPKAEFFDAVADSKDAIEIGHVAKVLEYDGVGRNRLFKILRDEGWLMSNNVPYQEYIDRGYFRVIEQKYTTPYGDTNINIKTLVYQRGVDAIRKMLDKKFFGKNKQVSIA